MPNLNDELTGLRGFLTALEDPATEFQRDGKDIKPDHIASLKREIANLEAFLERIKNDAISSE
jgi:hypothetical protein